MNDDSNTGEIINSLARFGVSDKMLLLCTWIIDRRWTMELSFEKWENGKWYVVFPDYDGDQEDLEMVDGADKFLDVLTTDGVGKARTVMEVSDVRDIPNNTGKK